MGIGRIGFQGEMCAKVMRGGRVSPWQRLLDFFRSKKA